MRRRTGGYVVAALLLGFLAACTPPSTSPPASPSPAPPSVTPTPTPSPTENAEERRMRLDQEAAEEAYLAAAAEGSRLAQAGGALQPTKVLKDNASGFYLKVLMNGQRSLKQNGFRTDRPAIVSVKGNRGWSPSEVGLTACEDASGVRLLDRKGREVRKDRPRRFVQTLIAQKVGGRWKITDGQSKIVKTFNAEGICGS